MQEYTWNKPVLPWLMWGIVSCFYCYGLFLQISPSLMANDLMRSFNIGSLKFGHLAAFYFYAYALMQMPVGLLLDYYGSRKLLSLAAALCAVGCFMFSSPGNYQLAAIGRFTIGLGTAFAVIGSMNVISFWFPVRRFALLSGLTLTIGMLGITVGIYPFSHLVASMHWANAMLLLSLVGASFVILMAMILRDRSCPLYDFDASSMLDNWVPSFKDMFMKRENWLLACYGGLMFAPMPVFGALWGIPFLMQKCGISHHIAAMTMAPLFLGWAVGAPFWGWYSDRIQLRRKVLYFAAIVALFAIILIIYAPVTSVFLLIPLLFAFGIGASGVIIIFSMIKELNAAKKRSGTLIGFVNTTSVLIGGALAQPFVSWLLNQNWHGEIIDGVRIYTLADFQTALAVLPVGLFIGLFCVAKVTETNCQFKEPAFCKSSTEYS